nr:MAG: ORF1 [TTV-like mini virus]
MPYRWWYYRRQRRPQRWRRRRPPFRRRARRFVQQRFRRRRWVRKRLYKRHKKLKKITLKEWQPKKIVKCTITGNLCLFACGRLRINNNYTMYSESFVPIEEPGGGGWSIMQLTLRSLYDEYIHYHNWWTRSNQGLPLTRYTGCKITFYRSKYTDYIVVPHLCPPFSVTREDYLQTQPSRQLLNKHAIIVTKLNNNSRQKPYIKRRFYPPSLFTSKWYFQQDILNTPLIVLHTSACDLQQFYQPDDQISYNITLYSLNTFFENSAWEYEVQNGYWAKKPQATQTFYIYGMANGTTGSPKWKDLIFLANTQKYQKGKPITLSNKNNSADWGNPFHNDFTHPDARLYYSNKHAKDITNVDDTAQVTPLFNLYDECRYNPFKDTGIGNKAYFKSTSLPSTFRQLPTKAEIVITDYPLWLIAWGWISWQKKLKAINHIDTEYQLVVQSPFIEPKREWYVFMDWYFINPEKQHITDTEKQNWHPKFDFQAEQFFFISQSGPATPKINYSKCIQANCKYKFFLKWGGCPAPMEDITNPADQEKFPTPNTEYQGLTIQDPNTPKEYYLYKWDEKDYTLTEPAAKRISKHLSPTKYFTEYGALDIPNQAQTTESEETSTEEENQTLQETINKLKLNQLLLKQRLHRLTKKRKSFL